MIRTCRKILLICASILTIAGTFLPWIRWNNIWMTEDRPGGSWIYQQAHENDPVYVWNGTGTTGGFDVMITKYDKGIGTSRTPQGFGPRSS